MACPVNDTDVALYNFYQNVKGRLGDVPFLNFVIDYSRKYDYACAMYKNYGVEGNIEYSAKNTVDTYYGTLELDEDGNPQVDFKKYIEEQLRTLGLLSKELESVKKIVNR